MKRACLILPLALLASCQRQQDKPVPSPTAATPTVAAQPAIAETPAPPPIEQANTTKGETQKVQAGIPRKIKLPPAETPTPMLAAQAEVAYVCESGTQLRVSYQGVTANIAWTGGRKLKLTRGGRDGAGETYSGDGYTLQRRGNVVQLDAQAGGMSWKCEESASSA